MDAFSYLSVLLSIILGLAITQVLLGLRSLMHARSRVRMYLPTLIWAVLLLVVFVQSWWSEFYLSRYQGWTFLGFSVVVAHSICLYMLAALVLPDIQRDETLDLREHYFDIRRWFFVFVVLAAALGIAKDLVLEGHLPETRNLLFQISFIVTSIIAAVTRNEIYHRVLAPVAAVMFGAYVALLFSHLN
jgi:hypothetical protein